MCQKNSHVLSLKEDAKKCSPAFCKCNSNAKNPFGRRLNNCTYSCLDNLSEESLEKYWVAQFKYSCADLSDKEKSIVFLVGYVFPTFSLRLRFSKKSNPNSPEILQKYLAILAARKLGNVKQELPEHKLVNTINRGRLMEYYTGSFP